MSLTGLGSIRVDDSTYGDWFLSQDEYFEQVWQNLEEQVKMATAASATPKTDFSLFRNLTLVDSGRQRTPKALNPEGEVIRIMSNGSVYPGFALVRKYNLAYEESEVQNQGNGIDVIDTADWDKFKELPRAILLAVVPKGEPKVELFSSCRRDDKGMPLSNVLTQGTKSTLLLNLVKELGYLTEGQKYCDLVMLTEHEIKFSDGISHVPKVIERGDRKGEKTYVRRENITYYPATTAEEHKEMSTVRPNELVTI